VSRRPRSARRNDRNAAAEGRARGDRRAGPWDPRARRRGAL